MYRFRKFGLGVLIILFITGCANDYPSDYPNEDRLSGLETNDVNEQLVVTTSENIMDKNAEEITENIDFAIEYEGKWYRTNVASYQWAEMTISGWKEGESFEVVLDAVYLPYSGAVEGTAIFIDEDVAVLYDENVEIFLQNRDGDHGIYFQFFEDSIVVTHESSVRMCFGGGGIVTAEGTYIQGEPEYTNCTDVSEIFTENELEEIQELLGESYNALFINMIELGEITEYAVDNGRLWEAYKQPYASEWCNILIYKDGRIYIEGCTYPTGVKEFYTNSEDTEMPDIELLKGERED